MKFLRNLFSKHGFCIVLALAALALVLLMLYVGFWRMLFIVLCVVAGAAAGAALDRRMNFMEFIRRLFQNDQEM